MKYFAFLLVTIIFIIFLAAPIKTGVFAATTTQQSAEDQQMQAILNQVQQNQIAKNQQIQQQQAAASQQAGNQDPAKNNLVQLSGWMYAFLIIYCITILLFWIFLIMAIFSMARWMRKQDKNMNRNIIG